MGEHCIHTWYMYYLLNCFSYGQRPAYIADHGAMNTVFILGTCIHYKTDSVMVKGQPSWWNMVP